MRFIESRDALVTAARLTSPAGVFLRVEGAGSRGIVLDGGDLSRSATPVAFESGAPRSAVKSRL